MPYPETNAIYLLNADFVGYSEFLKVLEEYAPKWVIDVRVVPRLDTLAHSRSRAFELFHEQRANYIDLFGRLHVRSYRHADSNPAFWGKEVLTLLKAAKPAGPYLFLFDNQQLIGTSEQLLPEILLPLVGAKGSVMHLKVDEEHSLTAQK